MIEGELNQTSIPDSFNVKEIIIGNKVTHIDENTFLDHYNLTTVYIPDNAEIIDMNSNKAFFSCLSLSAFPNSTTTQVKQWFNDGVFGQGANMSEDGPHEDFTLTCKDGIVHAVANYSSDYGPGGWNVTITPL